MAVKLGVTTTHIIEVEETTPEVLTCEICGNVIQPGYGLALLQYGFHDPLLESRASMKTMENIVHGRSAQEQLDALYHHFDQYCIGRAINLAREAGITYIAS